MIDTGLKGKVVLVTGANSPMGIGAATARAFAAQGAHLYVTYLRPKDEQEDAEKQPTHGDVPRPGDDYYMALQRQSAELLIEDIRRQGGKAEAAEVDLSDPAVIPTLFDNVEAALGPLDVVVNNAAYSTHDTFLPHPLNRGTPTNQRGEPRFAFRGQ